MNHIDEQYRREGVENAGATLDTSLFTAIILAALTALSIISFTGCGSVAEGSDPLVVQAERTAEIAFETFDSFLKMEFANKEALLKIDPKIHETAEVIRRNGSQWIEDLRTATKAYKRARDPDSQSRLNAAMAAIQSALDSSQKYLEKKKELVP